MSCILEVKNALSKMLCLTNYIFNDLYAIVNYDKLFQEHLTDIYDMPLYRFFQETDHFSLIKNKLSKPQLNLIKADMELLN